jgi:hypothetical protein
LSHQPCQSGHLSSSLWSSSHGTAPSRRTRRGRTKTAAIRVLTTLLDPDAFQAAEIAALYAARWQVKTAFLHLKKPSAAPAALARQEAWALLLVHNMIAALAAEAAVTAGTSLAAVSFHRRCPSPASTSPPIPAAATAGSARPAAATRAPGSPPPSPPSR